MLFKVQAGDPVKMKSEFLTSQVLPKLRVRGPHVEKQVSRIVLSNTAVTNHMCLLKVKYATTN